MDEHKLDKLFKTKVGQNTDLPKDIQWNSKLGWDQYQEKFASSKTVSRQMWLYVGSAAASILVFFLVYTNLFKTTNELVVVENTTGHLKEVQLPGGNTVWLNRNSSIEFFSKMDKKVYEISVQGEVYFDIRELKSKEYLISVENAYVRVNNSAAFNVREIADEENIDVTVTSGAVKVGEQTYDEGLALLVTEGNYCSVHKSHMLVFASSTTNENYMAWITGKFTFNDTPMETVINVLAEYYNTDIELENPGLAWCMFNGSFDADNINLILNQIHADLDAVIKNAGYKITISGQGCI